MQTASEDRKACSSACESVGLSPGVSQRPQVARTISATCSSLLRQVYRATHHRDQWHSERLWPRASISRDVDGRLQELRFGRRRLPIANHSGCDTVVRGSGSPTVHLIASGPSIADIDYSLMTLGNVLGVNGAIALASRHSVKFTHYCITDTGFLRNRPDLVATILSQDLMLFTTPVALTHILHHFAYDRIRCKIFLLERVGEQVFKPREPVAAATEHAHGDLTLFDPSYGLGFSHDIRRGIFPGGTVAYEALQILTWLGFRQIYLHGIDLSNADQAPRFYENETNKQPCHLMEQLESVIKPSFRAASNLLREKGVCVFNLSQRSALTNEIFPVVDWQGLVQGSDFVDKAA
jgi:hypothetical protein